MSSWPTGYAYHAALHCPSCAQKHADTLGIDLDDSDTCEAHEIGAVFGTNESDSPDHCAECGAYIEQSYTLDGVAYIVSVLREECHEGSRTNHASDWADSIRYRGLRGIQRGWIEKHDTLPWKSVWRCGDVVIQLYESGDAKHTGKTRYGFVATLHGTPFAKGNSLECPHDWTPAEVAAEVVAWLVDAPAKLRVEFGWKFDPDELLAYMRFVEHDGTGLIYEVVEIRN